MIEGVISFPSKLEVALLTADREALYQRQINIVDAGVPDAVLGGISRITLARYGKRSRVEPRIKR